MYPNIYVLWIQPCGWFLLPVKIGGVLRGTFIAAIISNQLLHGMTLLPLEWFRRMGRALKRKWHDATRKSALCFGDQHDNPLDNSKCINGDIKSGDDDEDNDDDGKIQMGIDLPWYYYLTVVC